MRDGRGGQGQDFSIEPTAGPVGTELTIYGPIPRSATREEVRVRFAGGRDAWVHPSEITEKSMTVVVPEAAETGAVEITYGDRQLLATKFAVAESDDGLLKAVEGGKGLVGAVYQLEEGIDGLPDFGELGEPYATIAVPNLDVPTRRFDKGFPGIGGGELLEWFGIEFKGDLHVSRPGQVSFKLKSDDGSRLWIDGELVVDNDGVHSPRAKTGSVHLDKGVHSIKVEYFQGPRHQIALQLMWKQRGRYEIVPPSVFTR